jgi:hypothetical protein
MKILLRKSQAKTKLSANQQIAFLLLYMTGTDPKLFMLSDFIVLSNILKQIIHIFFSFFMQTHKIKVN